MGKWCEVKCSCPDRVLVDSTQPIDAVYRCGHKDGTLFQCWPGYIFRMGRILEAALKDEPRRAQDFEILFRICNWRNYEDEYLSLARDARDQWRLEIEELQAAQRGQNVLSRNALQKWNSLWSDFFKDPWHREDAKSVDEILANCLRLCDASMRTANPIEFYL